VKLDLNGLNVRLNASFLASTALPPLACTYDRFSVRLAMLSRTFTSNDKSGVSVMCLISIQEVTERDPDTLYADNLVVQ
jgi:hypothetical protein